MRRLARRLSPFLTVYLLIVSLGLPLHKVYCACRDITNFSLFDGDHHCDGPEEILAGVEARVADFSQFECCRKALGKCAADLPAAEHDCGDEETILAKFTADYLFGDSQLELDLEDWNPLLAIAPVASAQFVSLIPKALPVRGPDPPPLPYGRDLLLRRQLFLC